MTKEAFIDQYLDQYERNHPNERINYDAIREQADCAWYDREVEANHATEYDLTPEQEKTSKNLRKGARAVNAYGKEVKRERKANPDKREIIATVAKNLTRICGEDCESPTDITIPNQERQIDFLYHGISYSLTLTAHRPPKG